MSVRDIRKVELLNEALLLTWFQSSRLFITWDGKLLQIWTREGAEVFRYRFEKIFRVSRNPVRDAIVVGGSFISEDVAGYVINHSGEITGVVDALFEWSIDGEKILGFSISKDRKVLNIWSYSDFKITKQNTVRINKQLNDLNWGFEPNYVLGINRSDNKAYIIEVSTGKKRLEFKTKGELTKAVWSPYANLVAVGDTKGNLIVYRINFSPKGKLRKEEAYKYRFGGAISNIKWYSTNQLILLANHNVNLINIDTEEIMNFGKGTVFDATFDINYVAVGYLNTVRIHGAISGEQRRIITLGGKVNDLEFSPDGAHLAIASSDYIVRIIDESSF